MSAIVEYVRGRYDDMCRLPELRTFFGDTDFMNFGYFEKDTTDQREACENLMDRLLDYFPDKTGRILDVACGKGQTTAYLAKDFPPEHVAGINISAEQLAFARKNAPNCQFHVMNATSLDFDNESFDKMICVEAAFHFDTKEQFLQEAFRVLTPGGYLVLSDILFTYESSQKRESITEANYVADVDEYKAVFRRVGFEVLDVTDATEECWRAHFWFAVNYFHSKFLRREITQEELANWLHFTYARVPDLDNYLLVAARKPQ